MERNRRNRLPWAIVLLIVAVCCLIAYGSAALYRSATAPEPYVGYEVLQLDGVDGLQAVSDGIVYYDGSTVLKVGADAETKWSYLVGSGADFAATDAGVAAWIGRSLTVIDNDTGDATYSGKMDAEVLSARVGSQYAAVLIGPEHNSTIVLMETGGRKVDSITLSDQTVIDYGFFYNDTLFWVMALDTNGTVPSCRINTYRPGRRMVGSISDSEQILYHAMFQSAQISCAGGTHIKVYNYNGTEEVSKRKLVYGWTLADADDANDNPMMAFVPNGQYDGNSTMKDVRMIRGEKEQTVRMPFGCNWLVARGDWVYGFSSDGYMMIAQMGVQKVEAHRLNLQYDRVYGVTDNGVAILGSGSLIYLVSL